MTSSTSATRRLIRKGGGGAAAGVRDYCPSVVVVHNHPSGDPTPSADDILITRQIRVSGEMMDVALLDHVIIGGNGYVSMKDKGLGF